jgi:hypothetical protein
MASSSSALVGWRPGWPRSARSRRSIGSIARTSGSSRSSTASAPPATATHPLFSQNDVDAAALDQIAAFDRALADQLDEVEQSIAALESADPKSPEFRDRSTSLTNTIEALHNRFDRRDQVITSGRPSADPDVLALLQPTRSTGAPVAYRLHEGEALSYNGQNYSIIGRVSAETASGSWRTFQLRGGTGDEWLHASADPGQRMYWLRRVEPAPRIGGETVEVNGQTYNRIVAADGSGDVIGPHGSLEKQAARLLHYQSASGPDVVISYQWGASTLVFTGTPVEPADLDFFTRET